MNFKRFILLNAVMLFSAFAFAQNTSDNRQSLPGNETHDKLFYLLQDSKSTVLPAETVDFLESINDSDEVASKMFYYRSSILKALYNPAISKADKVFICEHYGNRDNDAIRPIRALLQQHLDLNSN